jgi:hypothetical protein
MIVLQRGQEAGLRDCDYMMIRGYTENEKGSYLSIELVFFQELDSMTVFSPERFGAFLGC